MKIKYLYFLLLNLVFNLILFLLLREISQTILSFYLLSWYSVILMISILFFSLVITNNLFSLLTLFSLFYFLFLYGRLIVYCISPNNDIFTRPLMGGFYVGEYFMTLAVIIANILIIVIHGFFIASYKTQKNWRENIFIKPSNSKLFFRLFLFFSVLSIIKFIIEAIYISKVGYINLYINGLENVDYHSVIIKQSYNFLIVIYGIILQKVPNKRKFLFCSFIISLVSLTASLKGARILFLLPILFSFWYYYRFYTNTNWIKQIRKSVVLFFVLIIFLMGLKSNRLSGEFEISNPFSEIGIILNEGGTTLQTVGSYLKIRNKVKSDYPFVLEPLLFPYFYLRYYDIMSSGQSIELIKIRNSLNHRLAYYSSANEYLNGSAMGSSIVAEAYQYGLIYLILIGAIFGRYLIFMENNLKNGSVLLFLSPSIIVPTIIFAARESPFPNTWGILKYIIIFWILKLVIQIVKGKTKNKQNIIN